MAYLGFLLLGENGDQKHLGKEGVNFTLHFQVTVHQWGKPGQEPEAQTTEGCSSLVCSQAHAWLYTAQDHLPEEWCRPQWAKLTFNN